MIVVVLAAAAAVAFGLAAVLLRRYGPGYRVARILRAAPDLPLAEVEAEARAGRGRYVRVRGRISSDEEFPDEHDRPLVYRRRRVQLATAAGWQSIEDRREAVPFGIAARGAYAGVAIDQLDEGLVVLPRESVGRAGEVPEHVPAGTPPDRGMRLLIEQVSAVEHAFVAGVPALDEHGRAVLTAGAGRPLIVSTLEIPEAMRVLGGADRGRAARVTALLGGGALLALCALAAAVTGARG